LSEARRDFLCVYIRIPPAEAGEKKESAPACLRLMQAAVCFSGRELQQ